MLHIKVLVNNAATLLAMFPCSVHEIIILNAAIDHFASTVASCSAITNVLLFLYIVQSRCVLYKGKRLREGVSSSVAHADR
jgi:hypothetical protein